MKEGARGGTMGSPALKGGGKRGNHGCPRYDLRRTRRSPSSLPGWRIASTWSPGRDEVRRPRDPRPLEHVQLRRVPVLDLVLELRLELLEAIPPLLDQGHLVPEP